MWQLLASGSPDEFETATPTISDLPSGTPIRLEITTTLPIAPIFDLWGMEWVVEKMWGDAHVEIKDVHSVGWNKAVVYGAVGSSPGAPVALIIIAISVVLAIAGIAWIVRELRLLADVAGPVAVSAMVIAGIAVVGFLGYAIYKHSRGGVRYDKA